ncbi:MAG: hypothetical protein HUK17_01940 [Bacteroidales bacterium]|nr:hypothetical protein [Bacteroidales bacterium]
MNAPSQQLTSVLELEIAFDQPLRGYALVAMVKDCLGENCAVQTILGKKVIVYTKGAIRVVLLCKCTTYLGNPHPLFKKRIQIPDWWCEYTQEVEKMGYDVRFVGVYHYDGFVVFTDFEKSTYMERRLHNSSAHVYINDLYKGASEGLFQKTDRNGNRISCILARNFAGYLNGTLASQDVLLQRFAEFNNGFPFGEWITAIQAIQEMHNKHWSQWRQAEWAGFFLEYKFSQFAAGANVAPWMQYVALQNKGHKVGSYDFDIFFPQHNFYGDLKASDIGKPSTPANDQETTIRCISQFGKLWYVVYEHETIPDRTQDYEATRFRNNYLKEIDHVADGDFDEMSYHQRMKHSVRFVRMSIIELNRINYREALSDFLQGHQPDGGDRKKKFLIKKSVLENDNMVIFRHTYLQKQ